MQNSKINQLIGLVLCYSINMKGKIIRLINDKKKFKC